MITYGDGDDDAFWPEDGNEFRRDCRDTEEDRRLFTACIYRERDLILKSKLNTNQSTNIMGSL